jgi:hypothetical protein
VYISAVTMSLQTKKKIRAGQIEVDLQEFAIVANYTTEIHHLDELGNPVHSEAVPGQKRIRVDRNLQPHNISSVAQDIVDKCKYIHNSKVREVEQLLGTMVQCEPQRKEPQAPLLPEADINRCDDYADQLYEEKMELKVHGAKCILSLCTQPGCLEFLADNETLLGVLSRELRENSKKSYDLSTAIACCFLCFSHFSQFHALLMQHQCGDVTMRVLEYESKRYRVRLEEITKKVQKLEELGPSATGEDRKQVDKDQKKHRIQLNKQDKLMQVCMLVLLNLAEDVAIEKKMVNRSINQYLCEYLDRTAEDPLLVALTFLKKLSIFEENKEKMVQGETLSRLVHLSSHHNTYIALLALRVLYNFSFDENVRSSLVESGLVKLLVDHLRNPPFRHIVLRLLYHFSMDDRCKSLLTYYQDCMVMLLQLVVHFPEARVGKDLVALCVNLATHPRAADLMVESGLFPQVMMRVIKTRDPLLCKVIRLCSSHDDVREKMYNLLQSESVRMSKWMVEFVRMAIGCIDNPDLLVEVLGTLGNMTGGDVMWGELCEAGLVDLLHRLLVAGFSEDDVVLECVMLVATVAQSKEAVGMLAVSKLPAVLQDLLAEKQEDDEIVLQLLFTFHCLTIHEETREVILQDTQVASCVMELMRDKNARIRDQAQKTLSVIAEFDSQWTERIKAFRFQLHNQDWCAELQRQEQGGGQFGYYDDDPGGGDEEGFVFHWDDVGDAGDLADRDWGNYQHWGNPMYDHTSIE